MSKNFDKLLKMADEMIACENEDIEKKYGVGYNSQHEFESVLREEIEEAEEDIQDLTRQVKIEMWEKIRRNEEIDDRLLQNIELTVRHCISELTQVAAVAQRYRHGIQQNVKERKKKA